MSFVKLGEKIFNTDHIVTIEDSVSGEANTIIRMTNGDKFFMSITKMDVLEALGPSLISIGGMYIDPDEVLAVSSFTDANNAVVEDKALIWLGPGDDDFFSVPVSPGEAVALINKG